jgi:hypothetical protein
LRRGIENAHTGGEPRRPGERYSRGDGDPPSPA